MHKFTHLIYITIIAVMGILIYIQQQQPVETTSAAIPDEQEAVASKPGDDTVEALETEIEQLQLALNEYLVAQVAEDMENQRKELLQQVEEEARNPEWAEPIEAALQDLFNNDLDDAELHEVNCRTTVCKLVVSSGELGLGPESDILMSAIGEERFINRGYTIAHQPQDDGTTLVLIELEPRPDGRAEDNAG